MDDRRHIGAAGERVAAAFLRRQGGRVLGRNVSNEHGELDLIARIDGRLAAVEVRSRVAEDPIESFDWSKIDRVRRTAANLTPPCHRIDLITVEFTAECANVRWMPDV